MRSSLYSTQQPGRRDEQGTSATQAQFEEEVMQENEALLNALGNTVNRMKATAGALREEAEGHNKFLDTVSSAFSIASGGVNRSVQRIEGVMGHYGWRHTLLIGAVIFFSVYCVYLVLKR
ncbi:putative Qc-SNARE protein [Trypanosoma grayi]|uniref:putative Qc-SNARE protein n=1 Tax=Trypanosoma grayi TaxID=71804 RepID=UPI0004F438FF|nr:putative Qc-SNARE protein [Trypanosoma grayi]KEG08394.1 putative Qc-SNARE protein [Trypanosoma grayi]